MSRPRAVLERASLLVLGVAAALALAEAALRLWLPPRPVLDLRGLHEFRPEKSWLYGLRPGAEGQAAETGGVLYRINADGFRGPRHARPKPPGGVRVVVLGDSVAFGYAVEEASAFPRVLEARLAARFPEAGFEVVNLGVGGYNAWNEVELLRDVGLAYQPDLVLVQFCINDLNDPTLHFDAQTRLALDAVPDAAFPDPSRRRGSRHAASSARVWCARSKLCTLLQERWLASHGATWDPAARRAAGEPVETPDAPEWRWLEARYREMAAVAAGTGAHFAVLAFPYRAQLDAPGPHPVEERLRALARANGWTLVDPLPAFRAARRAGTPLFVDWWHPSPAGHRIAAEATLRTLACAGALGEAARGACTAGGAAADG
jgi:hypothetical protein